MLLKFFLVSTSFVALTCPIMASAQSSTETYAHSDAHSHSHSDTYASAEQPANSKERFSHRTMSGSALGSSDDQ